MAEPTLTGRAANALIGKNTQIVFEASGFRAQATGITANDRGAREAIDVTHMGSPDPRGAHEFGGMEKIPSGVADAGSIDLTLIYDPDQEPPWRGDAEAIRIELPAKKGYKTGPVYVGEGFLTNEGIEVPVKEAITQTATIECTGVWKKIPAVKIGA